MICRRRRDISMGLSTAIFSGGVEEYWIVAPLGKSVEIYYLEGEKYILEESYILQEDPEDVHYNAETEICLRGFPNIRMTLAEIFKNIDG